MLTRLKLRSFFAATEGTATAIAAISASPTIVCLRLMLAPLPGPDPVRANHNRETGSVK
jgi:hypothetical protein